VAVGPGSTPPISVPVADPGANYRAHSDDIDAAIDRVLMGGRYILGPEVDAFEEEFARYIGVRHAIGTGSGTDALQLALRACDIGPGDTIITVSHTAVATVAGIELVGATPLLIDIDPETLTIDAFALEAAIQHNSANVKAVIPVHLYGRPADMPAILEIARRHGIVVIEDCCQAHGATIAGRRVGAWGDLAAFSFYPTKNLGALGDGGAVVTDDPGLADRCRTLRQYGWRRRYVSDSPGINTRLDEIQAAILRVKLRHLDNENAVRRSISQQYIDVLRGSRLTLPVARDGMEHVYHQFVVRSQWRDALADFLASRGVATAILYPVPIHAQPAYGGRTKIGPGGLGRTEQVCREILSLPMYPELTDEQVRHVWGSVVTWQAQELEATEV
jgi:dTDP-4-amino-4,6-dideoxygalactose transaminase